MSRSRSLSQAGFTLIEVMVAALVLVLAFTALATVFLSGEGEASASVQESDLINIADQQMEQIRAATDAIGFSDLAMSAVPTVPSTRTTVQNTWASPNMFVETGTSPCGPTTTSGSTTSYWDFEIASNYDDVNTGATSGPYGTSPSAFIPWSGCTQSEPLEVIPASGTTPMITVGGTEAACGSIPVTSPCSVTEGGAQYDVYTYVTDTYVGCATGVSATAATLVCPSGTTATQNIGVSNPVNTSTCTFPTSASASTNCADGRRVTIAVVPTTQVTLSTTSAKAKLSRLTPVYISSIFTNPTPTGSGQSSVGLTLGGGI